VRGEQGTQQSVRLGPLTKMKNVGGEPAVFEDAMTKALRSVNPGDWVYVFEKQAESLLSIGMERMGG